MRILMVCLGNICRSPIAEGILQHKIDQKRLNWIVDSAGTSGWHDGESPDVRAIKCCKNHGIDITRQISRKLTAKDFIDFDVILAMDKNNVTDILKVCPDPLYASKVKLAMSYSHESEVSVPDPYYDDRFELVYEMLDKSLDHFIKDELVSSQGC